MANHLVGRHPSPKTRAIHAKISQAAEDGFSGLRLCKGLQDDRILPTAELAMYSRDVEQEGHAKDWNPLPTS